MARPRRGRLALFGLALSTLTAIGSGAAIGATPSVATVHPRDPSAGETERISFARGTDHSSRAGSLAPGEADRYVLRAGAGQLMNVVTSSADAALALDIFAPDGTELSGLPSARFSGRLPATGDYTLVVSAAADHTIAVRYSLAVRILARLDPCGSTQRIRFARGADHATVTGSFCVGHDRRFVLRAGAGQTMTVTGIETGTAFSVIAPDGSTLPGGPGETISYPLPATGDYTIVHGPRRSEVAGFEFTVTIPPLPR